MGCVGYSEVYDVCIVSGTVSLLSFRVGAGWYVTFEGGGNTILPVTLMLIQS